MSSLVARALTYAASGLVAQAAIFFLWMAMPWFMVPAELGYLSLALFAVEFLTTLGMMGMDAALIRFAVKPETRGATFGIALILAGSTFTLLAGVVLPGLKAGQGFFSNTAIWVSSHYGLVLAAVAANIVWNLVQSVQVAGRQAREYALLQAARAAAQLVLGWSALAFLERDAATVLGAITFATLVVMVLLRRRANLPAIHGNLIRAPEAREMARYGLSLMVYGVLGVAVAYTQRLVVDHYADVAVLGVFAFFNVIVLQVNGLWGALNKAWTPEFFALVDQDRDRALKLLQGMLALLCIAYPLGLAVIVAVGEVFGVTLVFPAAYAGRTEILWLLLLAPLFTGLYTITYPLYYYDLKPRRILAISLFLAVSNLALSVVFIRAWGTEGAAASFLLLAMVTAWIYLALYHDWAGGRLPTLLAMTTTLSCTAALLLLVTDLTWLFVAMLFATSIVAWMLGGGVARPLIRGFAERVRVGFASPHS